MNIKILTLTVLAAVASSTLSAQSTPAGSTSIPDQRLVDYNKKIAEELGLEQQQMERMIEADKRFIEAQYALRGEVGDRETLMVKHGEIREQHDLEIREILTPEQYEKLASMRVAGPTAPRSTNQAAPPAGR